MQIEISLKQLDCGLISFNHRYELGAMIIRTLHSHNRKLAEEIHNSKKIKLYAVSPLNCSAKVQAFESGMKMPGHLYFRIACAIPEVITEITCALWKEEKLQIGENRLKVIGIEIIKEPIFSDKMSWRCFGSVGSIAVGWTDENKKKHYLRPEDAKTTALLAHNLKNKALRYSELTGKTLECGDIKVSFITYDSKRDYKPLMHSIKGINVQSFRCPVRIDASKDIQSLVWSAGLGNINAYGFGLMKEGMSCIQ